MKNIKTTKTAKWVLKSRNPVCEVYTCSNCKREVTYNLVGKLLDEFPYCNCGAEMSIYAEIMV